jgi:hypothetical protein
MMN